MNMIGRFREWRAARRRFKNFHMYDSQRRALEKATRRGVTR